MPHGLWKRVQLSLQKLPTVIKSVKKLEKKLDELKGEIEEAS